MFFHAHPPSLPRPAHRRLAAPFARLAAAVGVWAAVIGCESSVAAPFVPAHDDDVVEQLPARIGSPDQRRQQRLAQERLKRQPAQLPLALQLAREAIDRARRLGDPRELGQAQAALAPWWTSTSPPPAVRLLRAVILQSQHAFPAALQDLDVLVRPGGDVPLPLRAQAELTRASVLQVQGRWPEAEAGCTRLASPVYASLGAAVQWPARACLAELASLQGRSRQASRDLASLARDNAPAWLTLMRAELAERRGEPAAEALFRQALRRDDPADQGVADVYSLAALADWLLDHRRAAEVVPLLAGREDADALLLRLAIAWRATGDPRAVGAIRTLGERFDAAALRGDRSHGREQARFELDLQDAPAAALPIAQANWAVQKEPADALVLLRAAEAAHAPAAADPVRQLVSQSGWEDVRLMAAGARPTVASLGARP